MDIPHEFVELINTYLVSVLESDAEHKGWKIPETTLVFPWIARMFPDIKYINFIAKIGNKIHIMLYNNYCFPLFVDILQKFDHTVCHLWRHACCWLIE